MLSYRHGFHAGNHADLLKHTCLSFILEKLKQKNKPFTYIDTHSGAGVYKLDSEMANKTAEYQQGIAKVWPKIGELTELASLESVISSLNNTELDFYPGSPMIAATLLREQDSIQLMELHNNEVDVLRDNLSNDERVHIHHRNGFEGLAAITPPEPKRGVVLIDPSYELKSDYQEVIDCVAKTIKRWPVGIFAIWYPILASARDYSGFLTEGLAALEVKNALKIELSVEQQAEDFGMHGSGMLILNAPWQLDEQMDAVVHKLCQLMAQDSHAAASVQWLKAPE